MRSSAALSPIGFLCLCSFLTAVLLTFLAANSAFALSPRQQRSIDSKAKHYNIPVGSATYNRLRSRLYGSVAEKRNEHLLRKPKNPDSIVLHLRGEHGTEIPSQISPPRSDLKEGAFTLPEKQTELVSHKKRKAATIAANHKLSGGDIALNRAKNIMMHNTPRTLSTCRSSSTITKPNRSPFAKMDSAPDVLLDALFVAQGVPNSREFMAGGYEDLFGRDCILYPYSNIPNDWVSLQASKHGIQCLPTRIFVTKNKISIHTGVNALKYYEVTPARSTKGEKNKKTSKKERPGKKARSDSKRNLKKKEKVKKVKLKKQKMYGKLHPQVQKRLDDFLHPGGKDIEQKKAFKGKPKRKKTGKKR